MLIEMLAVSCVPVDIEKSVVNCRDPKRAILRVPFILSFPKLSVFPKFDFVISFKQT